MDNYFEFNGISSLDMGLVVEKVPDRRVAEKDLEEYRVPGRSEPLHIWKQSWAPYPVKYKCWFRGNPPEKQLHEIAEWLHGAPVRSRLEDSYDTTVYHWATYKGGADVDMLMREVGKFTVEFTVGAQAFLKKWETALTLTNGGGILNNPTPFATRPLIHVVGAISGGLKIGDNMLTLVFPGMETHDIWIDCEEQEAWEIVDGVEVSTNSYIGGADFITIQPGRNDVSFPNSFELVEIWTRVYTI